MYKRQLYDTVQKAFALPGVDATCTGNRELADVAPAALEDFLPGYAAALLACYPFFIYQLIQFMRGIPRDLDESACIDGDVYKRQDEEFLNRAECETYLRLTLEEQARAAAVFLKIAALDPRSHCLLYTSRCV